MLCLSRLCSKYGVESLQKYPTNGFLYKSNIVKRPLFIPSWYQQPLSKLSTNLIKKHFSRHVSSQVSNTSAMESKIYIGKLDGIKHWKLERLTILALIVAFINPTDSLTMIADTILAFMIPLHTFWGGNAIILDYTPTKVVQKVLNSWKILSVIHLLGLLWLNYNDIGITKLCQAFLYL